MPIWWGYKAAGKAIGGGARAGSRIGQDLSNSAAARKATRIGSRQAKRGWLAPGDPTPAPTVGADYLDYRGTATWKETRALEGEKFPLGAFADLQNGRMIAPIGLPETLLNRHAVVIGPAGSGKTAGVLIPWMYAAIVNDWSLIAVDVKGDLREDLIRYDQSIGGSAIDGWLDKWDYTDPGRSVSWEWLNELTTDARLDAAITAILGRQAENSTADPYFYQRDYRTLRGLLNFTRALSPYVRTAGQLIRLLEGDSRLQTLVTANPRAPGASDLDAVLRFPVHEYPKVISGVVTALSGFDMPGVTAVTSARQHEPMKFDLEAQLDSGRGLIIGAPLQGGRAAQTLSSLMLNQLAQRLYERFGASRRRVLLVIDEAPQVAGRVDLTRLLEVSRSAGVGVVLAMQDVAQFKDENDRSSILSNAATFLLLPGSSPMSVKAFSDRLGQRYEQTYSLSSGPSGSMWGRPQVNQNVGTTLVPVLGDREIMHPPVGGWPAIAHVNAHELGLPPKPFIVDLER